MKTVSMMESLLAPKSLKGQQIQASGFDGRSITDAPLAQGGFSESLKSLGATVVPAMGEMPSQPESEGLDELLNNLKALLAGQGKPGNTDNSKSQFLPSSGGERSSTDGKVSLNLSSLGLSQKISDNMSGEEILKTLVNIAIKHDKQQSNLPDMNLDQIKEAVEMGVFSIDQIKSMQKSLSQQGVQASVMDIQRILTASGYERSTQGNQVFFAKPEALQNAPGASSTPSQELLSQASSKPSFPDLGAGVQDRKESVLKGALDNSTFSQILKASQGSSAPISESSGVRLDTALNTQRQNAVSEWAPVVVNRNTNDWNKELVSALGDRLKMQVGQGVKEATVRLDPPELGRVDFSVRIDGDRVQVNINSSNAQVREMLAQQIERLRGELSSDNAGSTVDVNVGDGKDRGKQGQQEFANKDNENTVLPFDNPVELTSSNSTKKNNLGLNTKA